MNFDISPEILTGSSIFKKHYYDYCILLIDSIAETEYILGQDLSREENLISAISQVTVVYCYCCFVSANISSNI